MTFAIINGHYDVAELLADKGANVNLADRTGATPLYSAVDMHTLVTSFGRPDLPRAVSEGSVGAAKMLLAHGADPNAPLKTKVLKRTYQAGDARLAEGATPLMRAAKAGDVVMMTLLIVGWRRSGSGKRGGRDGASHRRRIADDSAIPDRRRRVARREEQGRPDAARGAAQTARAE